MEIEELNMSQNLDHEKFVVLNLHDVVKIDANYCSVLSLDRNELEYLCLTIEQLKTEIIHKFSPDISHRYLVEIRNKLFDYSFDVWILKPDAKSWKKGKLKVEFTVKFYPDELEEKIEENQAENSGNNNSKFLEGDEVIQVDQSTGINLNLSYNFQYLYMTVNQLQGSIIKLVNISSGKNQFFYTGLRCEVLRVGTQGWQKGKFHFEFPVKFYLDKPQEEIEENKLSNSENKEENYGDNNSEYLETELSPLDDLRQKFHQEN